MSRYHMFLLAAFASVWTWAAIGPSYPHDWLLENYLVFIFVPIILLLGRYFKLSSLSYSLITLYMMLHVTGSHYTYAEVPFGYTLQRWFGADRNMYDRLVHFCFGLLLAYPMREVFMRVARSRGVWGYWLPVELVLAFSAVYEIIEWLVAARVDPAAGIGAFVTMTLVAMAHWRYDPAFRYELRASLKIERGERPMGEQALLKLIRKGRL